MTFNDIAVSNIFLACIAFINIVILAMVYQMYRQK